MSNPNNFQMLCNIRAAFFRLSDLLGEFVPESCQTDSASRDVYTVLGAFDDLEKMQSETEILRRRRKGLEEVLYHHCEPFILRKQAEALESLLDGVGVHTHETVTGEGISSDEIWDYAQSLKEHAAKIEGKALTTTNR